jgi:hypothetical protein
MMTRIIRRGVAKLLLSRFVVSRSKLAAVDHPAAAFLVFPRWMPSAWRHQIACREVRRDLCALGLPWNFSDDEILGGQVSLRPVFGLRIAQLNAVMAEPVDSAESTPILLNEYETRLRD